jgi:hypothetical protein
MDYQLAIGILIILLLIILFSISHYQSVKMDNYTMTRHIQKYIKKKVTKNTNIVENFNKQRENFYVDTKPGTAKGLLHWVNQVNHDNKIKWAYLCPYGPIGSICSGSTAPNIKDQLNAGAGANIDPDKLFKQYREVGINVISLFANIWQPNSDSGKYGTTGTGTGNAATNWFSNSIDKLGDFTLPGNPDIGLSYGIAAAKNGIIPLLTIGSWDAIFPVNKQPYSSLTCTGSLSPSNWAVGESVFKTMDNVDITSIATALIKKAQSIGCVGFDFDIEGFGGSAQDRTQWDACNTNPKYTYNYNGEHFILPDGTTIDFLKQLFTKLKDSTMDQPKNTILNQITEWIITVVPTSISLYNNSKPLLNNKVPGYLAKSSDGKMQNHMAALDFTYIDGVLLQWYSGFGANVCGDDNNTACDINVQPKECDNVNSNGLKWITPSKRKTTFWTGIMTPVDGEGLSYPTTDNIQLNIHNDQNKIVDRLDGCIAPVGTVPDKCKGQNCPWKCPRKSDCPDWSYSTDTKKTKGAHYDQLVIIQSLANIPGLVGKTGQKLCIGIESFPNVGHIYEAQSGKTNVSHQFWGPMPSAYAICSLTAAAAAVNTPIAGIGVFTVNATFLQIAATGDGVTPGTGGGGGGGGGGVTPSGSSCTSGLKPFHDTPTSGQCSCGTGWLDANSRTPNVACN